MRRRQFIALLSGAAATWPLTARAQREPLRRVATLSPRPTEIRLGVGLTSAYLPGVFRDQRTSFRRCSCHYRLALA